MRKSIDRLATLVAGAMGLNPFGSALYLFCGKRRDQIGASASASATIYSLVETAKANGLNVYAYINYLLLYMPDADYQNDPDELDDLLPWSERVQT